MVEEGTDVWAIRNKRVSLCPIWYDLTEVTAAPRLARTRSALGKALGLVRGRRPKKPEAEQEKAADTGEGQPEMAAPAARDA
jgi:hypothetical protein